ncbi:MATE family efflux transporter [Sporofaciens sp. SGI.106]|uniref:MATE family efflux transporter n=1 Tax=Sporofaciens sp. SGI.106 TaxID=3420568 RepID=UPI003D07CE9F
MIRDNSIQLSDHFTYKKLFRFVIAPICTMLFTSIYGIVDGFFVSNYVGKTAFASLNLVMPYIMMIASVGFMFGSGGNALVSLHLGLDEKQKAKKYFSLIVYTLIGIGAVLAAVSIFLAPGISKLLGASEEMLPYCVLYLRINMIGVVFFMLQNLFQNFLITAEKPRIGFAITLIAGCTNMLLDWILVGICDLGIAGAAWATVTSQIVGGAVPFIYFAFSKSSILKLTGTRFEAKVIAKTCGNGVSEFLSNVSASIVGFLYNLQLMHYVGENGVSAYGVIMYVSFVFVAIYIGYSMGVAPIIGFNYGAGNKTELQNIFRKSVVILTITNIIMFVMAEVLTVPMAKIFVGYNQALNELTVRGMRIYSIAFLMMGFNVFASAFFTALSNGKISAIISVTRTLILQLVMIYVMPILLDVDGLWAVVIAVEGMSLIVTGYYIVKNRKNYGYF